MKKNYKIAILLCSLVFLFSCSKKNEQQEEVSSSPTSITTENKETEEIENTTTESEESEIEQINKKEDDIVISDSGEININGEVVEPIFIDETGNKLSVTIDYKTGEIINTVTGEIINSQDVQIVDSKTGTVLDTTSIYYSINQNAKKIKSESKEQVKKENNNSTKPQQKQKTENTPKEEKIIEKPAMAVTNLTGHYDGRTNEITLEWVEPTDTSFFDYVTITENGNDKNIVVKKGTTSVTFKTNSPKENTYSVISYSESNKKGYSTDCKVKAYMFTSLKLPLTGTAGAGNKVLCKLEGVNFNNDYISKNGITIKCPSQSSVARNPKLKLLDDEHITFELTIPNSSGIYNIVVSCGDNKISANFEVKQSPELFTIVSSNETPVAIITGYNTKGIAIGLGLKERDNLHWAVDGSFGFNTKFENIVSIPSVLGTGSAEEADFELDIDGYDNWNEICKIDKNCTNANGTLNKLYVKNNYPLFYAAITYGEYANIPSKYSTSWFIPSAKEMCDIYRNCKKINKILKELNGDLLSDDFYWTSTQNESRPSSATAIRFQNAAIFKFYIKSNAVYARCVREFPEL